MRIIGLDYGDKTIGVSVSDPLLITAFGLTILRRNKPESIKKNVKELGEIIKEYEADKIVLGYPKNMDNSEGERCKLTLSFKERLERNFKKIPVVLWDERLSSSFAERSLREADLTQKKISDVIDKMAAVYILQGYLDSLRKIGGTVSNE